MKDRHTIQITPGGLVNVGGQATIPENSWWETQNCTIGADGRMAKRAGLMQWGQTLKEPEIGGFGWQEIFSSLSHFDQGDIGAAGFATIAIANGTLTLTTTSTTADRGRYIRRNAQPSDGAIEAGETGKADLRLMLKANGPLPAQSGTTEPNGFHVVMRSDHANLAVFLFLDTGIHYWNGTAWTLISGTDIDDGSWHVVQFQLTSATTAGVYIDEELAGSVTFTSYGSSITLANERAALAAETNANGTYEIEVDFLQYRSGNDNIVGVPVVTLEEWVSPDPITRHLLVVAGSVIYDDPDHAGVFRTVAGTHSGALTTFAPFGAQLLIVNQRLPMRLWTGDRTDVPEEVPAGGPSNIYVAAQHQSRPVVVTERKPLQVYVGGANTLEDWTTEDFESPTGESFTFPIPDALGQRITALVGDHYGQLIIFTEDSIYALIGSSVDTYYLRLISSRIGCQGPRAVARVGGDLIFLSKHGVHSLQAVQEYGDLNTFSLSAVLRNLWMRDSQFDQPKNLSNYRASVVHAPHLGGTFVATQAQDGERPNRLYELNHDNNNQWSGPWTLDCEAVAFVLHGNPEYPMLMLGDSEGRVSQAIDDRKFDFGADAYTMKLRSARLDGRSLDPRLSRHTKIWRELRLYILPRGEWGVDATWTSDGHSRPGTTEPKPPTQNQYNEAILDTTFVLGTSKIVDSEKPAIVEITLDHRGKWLEFTVQEIAADQDLVVLRAEVDFVIAQPAGKEN